jgi:hypothetical protein
VPPEYVVSVTGPPPTAQLTSPDEPLVPWLSSAPVSATPPRSVQIVSPLAPVPLTVTASGLSSFDVVEPGMVVGVALLRLLTPSRPTDETPATVSRASTAREAEILKVFICRYSF